MIFLHIGLNKAGSSSIQAFCDQHRAALREQGLDYPTVGILPFRPMDRVQSHVPARA